MKRNLGNGIVKKSIVVAMSMMLISTSPIMNATAAENEAVTSDVTDTTSEEYVMSPEEEALVNKIESDLLEIGDKQQTLPTEEYDTYDVIDEAHTDVYDDVKGALDKEVGEAVDAVDKAAATMEDAGKTAESIDSNLDKYVAKTDELLNNDKELVDSVEGNADQFVETITPDGDILVNAKDENGDLLKVEDYTQKQADIATDAAQKAEEAIKNVTSGNTSVADAKKAIDEAIENAKGAEAEAQKAYNSAKAVLEDQIKRYNAYAAKYGLALYEYTDENGNVSTPTYTEEELAGLSDLTLNKDQISDGLDKLGNIDLSGAEAELDAAERLTASTDKAVDIANGAIASINQTEDNMVNGLTDAMNNSKLAMDAVDEAILAGKLNNIIISEQIVDECKKGVASAKDALTYVEGAEEEFIQRLESLLTDVEKALDDTTLGTDGDFYKAALQVIYEGTKALLEEYRRPLNETDREGIVDTYENRFNYASDSATDLADEVDELVNGAQAQLTDANTRYEAAKAEYEKLMAEYEALKADKATTDANFIAIEKKLKEAEAAVAEAKIDCDLAAKEVKKAVDIKKQLEDISKPSSGNGGSSSGSSSSSSSSTNGATAATPATTSITDGEVPLVDTPVTIDDEGTPLGDSVPKTGDATSAAGAVGATGLLAILGALFINLKKRTLR